ncbi:MAG: hypothetical protein AVDCRST_MAG06-315, partial [uncultured Nocardioides sp.]
GRQRTPRRRPGPSPLVRVGGPDPLLRAWDPALPRVPGR